MSVCIIQGRSTHRYDALTRSVVVDNLCLYVGEFGGRGSEICMMWVERGEDGKKGARVGLCMFRRDEQRVFSDWCVECKGFMQW